MRLIPDDGLESSEDVEDFLSRLLSRFGIFVAVVVVVAFFPTAAFVVAVTAFTVSISGFLIDLSTAVAAAVGAVLVFDPVTSVSIGSRSSGSVFGTSF